MHVICNSRVLSSEVTGVQRYTLEILKRLPEGSVRRMAPPSWVKRPFNLLWEQLVLPLRLGGDMLWCPSNTGPLMVRRQVVTVHDLATREFPQDFSALYRHYYDFLFPRMLPRVAGVVTVSEYTRQRVLEHYRVAPEKVHVVNPAVEHARFKPQTPEAVADVKRRLSLPKRYVLYLGTLSVRKNVGQLVRAWAKVQDAVSADVHLVLAGSAGAAHVFNGDGLPELPPRTMLTGRIGEGDLAPLLAGADCFVFPSLYEGFGIPPLEAMACGTPCITSNATSLPEVVGDAALTVSPHDDDAMAEALKALLTDPALAARLKVQGLAQAAKFSWEKSAAALWKVLVESNG